MGVVFLIVVGSALGWLAAIVTKTDNAPGMLRNGLAGIGGALVAGLGVSPLVARGDLLSGTYSVEALMISLAGSAVLLFAANLLLWRNESRERPGPKRLSGGLPRGERRATVIHEGT